MEKRVTFAVILCIVFAIAWMQLSKFVFPVPETPISTTENKPDGEPGGEAATRGAKESAGTPGATGEKAAPTPGEPSPPLPQPTREPIRAESEERTRIETELLSAEFSNRGASLRSLRLKEYTREAGQSKADPDNWLELIREYEPTRPALAFLDPMDASEDLGNVLWKPMPAESDGLVKRLFYVYSAGRSLEFRKTLEIHPSRYDIRMRVDVLNHEAAMIGKPRKFTVVGASGLLEEGTTLGFPLMGLFGYEDPSGTIRYATHQLGAFAKPEPVSMPAGANRLLWAALMNKYFTAVIAPADPKSRIPKIERLEASRLVATPLPSTPNFESADAQFDARLAFLPDLPKTDQALAFDLVFFAGPKTDELFQAPEFARFEPLLRATTTSFCFLDPIVLPLSTGLLKLLRILHWITGNWGIAIILLTCLVKFLLFPLTLKQVRSQNKFQVMMAKFKPELDRLKEKYKNNKQKLAEEQMKFYKEKGINPIPLGGCLPLLVTMPVFIALFYILNSTIDLRQAPFVGWIDDLARPDELVRFNTSIPLLCFSLTSLNLLPILMALSWFYQQKSQPKPSDPQVAQQQKMMMFMPFMMMFFLYNYAAGLSLYWITNSVLGIVEQKLIRAKFLPKPAPSV